jgi:formylmethanofuran dehydrogenase subunit E
MPKTLTEIAEEIADQNYGSFHLDWDCVEEYDSLTYEQQQEVQHQVYAILSPCDGCGWHFNIEDMYTSENGALLCWSCEEQNNADY